MSGLTLPYHRYVNFAVLSSGGSRLLLNSSQWPDSYFVLEGIDLVNNPVANGSEAWVTLQDPNNGDGQAIVFQAFTYTSSQGSFSWRGNMNMFPQQSLFAVNSIGSWSFVVWGHVEPAYGSFS